MANNPSNQRTVLQELVNTAAEVYRISERATLPWHALSAALKDARAVLAQSDETSVAPHPPHVVKAALEHVRGAGLRTVADILEDSLRAPETTCSTPSPSDNQESAFAFLLSVAADERFSNEYVGNVVRSWLHVLDGSSTPVKSTGEVTP